MIFDIRDPMTHRSIPGVNRKELALWCFVTASLSWILLGQLFAPHTVLFFWLGFVGLLLIPQMGITAVYVLTSLVLAAPLFARARIGWSAVSEDPGRFSYSFFDTVLLLAFVAASLRTTDLLQKLRNSGSAAGTATAPERKGEGARDSEPLFETGSFAAFLVWPAVIVLALLLLWLIPEDPLSRWRYRLTSGGLRAITFIWVLGFGWLAIRTLVGFIDWVRMDKDDAGIIVRSSFVDEAIRELGAIERRRSQ